MPTTEYSLTLPVTDGATALTAAQQELVSANLEEERLWGAELNGPGFFSVNDMVPSQIAATLGVQFSAGNAYVGISGAYRFVRIAAPVNITNGLAQGGTGGTVVIAANTTYWFWLNKDKTWTVNAGTNPGGGAQLRAVVAFGATQSATIDAAPPGFVLAQRRVSSNGRPATGHIRIAVNPTDADKVTVTNGAANPVTYEFDNNAAVTAGNILVTIGASAAATATNLATAINAQQGKGGYAIVAAAHPTDTTVVDLVNTSGAALNLTETTAGARVVVQDNAEETQMVPTKLYSVRRVIVAEDVTRLRIRINTGMTAILNYIYRLQTAAANNAEIGYNGVVTVTGGVIEFDFSGATDPAAGNVLTVIAVGT
jgi:hypothetical protein